MCGGVRRARREGYYMDVPPGKPLTESPVNYGEMTLISLNTPEISVIATAFKVWWSNLGEDYSINR